MEYEKYISRKLTKQRWKWRHYDTTPEGTNNAVEQQFDVCNGSLGNGFDGNGSNLSEINPTMFLTMDSPFLPIDEYATHFSYIY